MKKIIATLLSTVLMLGAFAGCGGTGSSSAASAPASTPAQETAAAAPQQPAADSDREPASTEESSTQEAQVAAQNFDIPMPLT